jgi:hypothetical protein
VLWVWQRGLFFWRRLRGLRWEPSGSTGQYHEGDQQDQQDINQRGDVDDRRNFAARHLHRHGNLDTSIAGKFPERLGCHEVNLEFDLDAQLNLSSRLVQRAHRREARVSALPAEGRDAKGR